MYSVHVRSTLDGLNETYCAHVYGYELWNFNYGYEHKCSYYLMFTSSCIAATLHSQNNITGKLIRDIIY